MGLSQVKPPSLTAGVNYQVEEDEGAGTQEKGGGREWGAGFPRGRGSGRNRTKLHNIT